MNPSVARSYKRMKARRKKSKKPITAKQKAARKKNIEIARRYKRGRPKKVKRGQGPSSMGKLKGLRSGYHYTSWGVGNR